MASRKSILNCKRDLTDMVELFQKHTQELEKEKRRQQAEQADNTMRQLRNARYDKDHDTQKYWKEKTGSGSSLHSSPSSCSLQLVFVMLGIPVWDRFAFLFPRIFSHHPQRLSLTLIRPVPSWLAAVLAVCWVTPRRNRKLPRPCSPTNSSARRRSRSGRSSTRPRARRSS